MNKFLKVTLIVLASLAALVLVLLLGIKAGEKIRYASFYKNADKEFSMPGRNDNLVQQGMVYLEDRNVFLICGYMSDNTASRVYVVSEDGEVLSHTALTEADGTDYLGHTGGIEVYGDCVYITNGTKEVDHKGTLDVFSLTEILDGKERTPSVGSVLTYNNPAFCHIYNGYMLVGEFYREIDYETRASHRIKTPAGDANTALITVFRLDDSPLGISSAPVAGITTGGAVQGMTTLDGREIVLSTSWGLSTSHLYFYDMEKITQTEGLCEIDGNTIPVYHLDSAALIETAELPPMAEGLVYKDGKIFVLNESACNKYIYGKFMSGNHLYSYHYTPEN